VLSVVGVWVKGIDLVGGAMRVAAAVMVMAVTVVAGCSGGGGSSLATVPPLSEPAPSTSVSVTSSVSSVTSTIVPVSSTIVPVSTDVSSTEMPSTEVPSTTTSTTVVSSTVVGGDVGLSAGGPWTLVDGAPGVTTPGLVYELMPKLWVFLPTVELPDDDSSLFVPTAEDIPIIEAYLRARLVFFRAATRRPIDLDDPGWAEAFVDGVATFRSVLQARNADGQSLDMADGIVLRPYVLGDLRAPDSVVVYDCMLDGGVWRHQDGSLSNDSTPGVIRNGSAALAQLSGAHWIVDRISAQTDACL